MNELLEMARDFGRVGLWERDLQTIEGRWDDQVRHFWGLAPGTPTPDFEGAAERIVDADRPRLVRHFRESLQPVRVATRSAIGSAPTTERCAACTRSGSSRAEPTASPTASSGC